MCVTDINECLDNKGGCNQICNNTEGSYHCLCNSSGYYMTSDNKTCQGSVVIIIILFQLSVIIVVYFYTILFLHAYTNRKKIEITR